MTSNIPVQEFSRVACASTNLFLLTVHPLNPWENEIQQLLVSLNRCPWIHVDIILKSSTSENCIQRNAIDIALHHVLIAPFSKHCYVL